MLSFIEDIALMRYFISLDQQRKRKLKQLALSRPRLHKEEYIEMLVEKGYNRKQVRIVYEILMQYVSFDGFCLYPEDDIRKMYLKNEEDFSLLLDGIDSKRKLKGKDELEKDFFDKNIEVITIETILKAFIN